MTFSFSKTASSSTDIHSNVLPNVQTYMSVNFYIIKNISIKLNKEHDKSTKPEFIFMRLTGFGFYENTRLLIFKTVSHPLGLYYLCIITFSLVINFA